MIRLSFKILVIMSILIVVANAISYCIVKNNKLFREFISRKEPWSSYTYDAIERSKAPSNKIIALLGDSVARQMLEDDKYEVLDLTTNMWVSMAGQFMLVNNLVKYQPQLKKICLLAIPESLAIDINTVGAYNYFIKPFYSDEYIPLMSSNTLDIIRSKPYYIMLNQPLSKVLPVFTIVNYNDVKQSVKGNEFLSPTSQYYITKMQQVCDLANVKLEIYPCPMSLTRYTIFTKEKFSDKLSHDLITPQLKAALGNYYNNIIIFDNKFFREDNLHRNGEHWPEVSTKIVNEYNLDKLAPYQ